MNEKEAERFLRNVQSARDACTVIDMTTKDIHASDRFNVEMALNTLRGFIEWKARGERPIPAPEEES